MDCERIDPELIGFHLGALDDETRQRVEQHLCDCGACLRGFLVIKQALDRRYDAVPSEASRARLREAASVELARRRRATLPLLRRALVPLAVAAALVLGIFMGGALSRRSSVGPVAAPGPRIEAVDTIHSATTSLDVL